MILGSDDRATFRPCGAAAVDRRNAAQIVRRIVASLVLGGVAAVGEGHLRERSVGVPGKVPSHRQRGRGRLDIEFKR